MPTPENPIAATKETTNACTREAHCLPELACVGIDIRERAGKQQHGLGVARAIRAWPEMTIGESSSHHNQYC